MLHLNVKEPNSTSEVAARDMKDGEVGVITKWSIVASSYVGVVVLRRGGVLVALVRPTTYWTGAELLPTDCRVRLFPPNTEITLTVVGG